MFIGLNVENISYENDEHYKIGLGLLNADKAVIKSTLESYIDKDGRIDGSALRNNWFPQIKADIFFSHSHEDEKLCITIAGFIYQKFRLKCFIDSCVWGYAGKLLEKIDEFAKQPDGYYNYQIRNRTTSHVHMLLASSLLMMIDKTECLFFFNTPKSIIPNEVKEKTFSPWIYSEIVFSQLVRRKSIKDHRSPRTALFSAMKSMTLDEAYTPAITHDVNIEHLKIIDASTINAWIEQYRTGNALDTLYQIIGDE